MIDYGRVPITETRSTEINLINSGSAQLLIDEVVYSGESLSFPLELPLIIEPGSSTQSDITFTPSSLGIFNEDISIRNNSPDEQQIINISADVFSPNFIRIEDKEVLRDQTSNILLNLVNNDLIRAIQFDIQFPNGFILDSENINYTSILDDFTISNSEINDNQYRFIIYNLSDNTISEGDNTIFEMPVFIENIVSLGDYNFDISNVILSGNNNENVSSEALLIGTISVIEDINPPTLVLTLSLIHI